MTQPAKIAIRPARIEDSREIARLFLISSDGLAEYIWHKSIEPGESVLDAGARRYARQNTAFSYENCLIAEIDGQAIGMAHSFPMFEDPEAEPVSDPVLAPYADLEDHGSLYLSGVAVAEDFRNLGVGGALMDAVNRHAKDLGLPRISLICFEKNEGAMRLYRRLGFEERSRRAVVPHPSLHYDEGEAVLLVRSTW